MTPMLVIRKEQLHVFDRDKRQRFVAKMLEHLQKFFPERCARIGETQLRQWVEHGISRAAIYGLASERDVCKYLDVMTVFGKDFDQDSRLPWASRILAVHHIKPAEKAGRLLEAAKENQPDTETTNG